MDIAGAYALFSDHINIRVVSDQGSVHNSDVHLNRACP